MLRESFIWSTDRSTPIAVPTGPYKLTARPTSLATVAGLYCERAQLKDGQTVLELGCGWGSLCLYLAERYPRSEITAVSNSKTQKQLIMQRAKDRRLTNLKVSRLLLSRRASVHDGFNVHVLVALKPLA
jgi:tRNA G46 methylase TrmB